MTEEFTYLVFYKPYGVLCDLTDSEGRPTLADYLPRFDVYPAGRLDLDSEGLLLLTNDGLLAHRLTDPIYEHSKTYWVQVEGAVTDAALLALEQGVEIKGGYSTRPAQVEVIAEPTLPPRAIPVMAQRQTSWLQIVLREGKKRQVRHMTAAVGFPTLRLVRIAIGGVLSLKNLAPGEWRALTPAEITALRQLVR